MSHGANANVQIPSTQGEEVVDQPPADATPNPDVVASDNPAATTVEPGVSAAASTSQPSAVIQLTNALPPPSPHPSNIYYPATPAIPATEQHQEIHVEENAGQAGPPAESNVAEEPDAPLWRPNTPAISSSTTNDAQDPSQNEIAVPAVEVAEEVGLGSTAMETEGADGPGSGCSTPECREPPLLQEESTVEPTSLQVTTGSGDGAADRMDVEEAGTRAEESDGSVSPVRNGGGFSLVADYDSSSSDPDSSPGKDTDAPQSNNNRDVKMDDVDEDLVRQADVSKPQAQAASHRQADPVVASPSCDAPSEQEQDERKRLNASLSGGREGLAVESEAVAPALVGAMGPAVDLQVEAQAQGSGAGPAEEIEAASPVGEEQESRADSQAEAPARGEGGGPLKGSEAAVPALGVAREPVVPSQENEAAPAVENEAAPAVENEAAPAVENEAAPAVENEAAPAVENEAAPAVGNEAAPAVGNEAETVSAPEPGPPTS
eukprot:1176267-Prorocentrum_minimum.AAC.2